jgi:molecular chaperone HscB
VAEPLVTLASNDFALFGVPAQFAQDRAAIDARWKDLQREAHPDRFAAQGAATQRQAMQWSVRINEAYQRLKDPLRRAAYLCELGGMPIQAESNTAMPAEFLLQQMEWREALDDAQGEADIDALHTEVMAAREQVLAECAQALDVQHDLARAVSLVRALMFLERFGADIEKRYDQLPASPASAATVVTAPGSAG